MSISRQTLDQYLFEFDQSYEVSYVNFSRATELADAQLILTLERECERKTLMTSIKTLSPAKDCTSRQ
jgi:Tfp pilus assembly ATPase PilU